MHRSIPPIHEDAAALKQSMQQEPHSRRKQRLHALFLLASGQARSRSEVARVLGVNREAVSRWLDRYAAGGLEAMLTLPTFPGRKRALSDDQLAALGEALRRPEGFASYIAIQAWIAETFGITMQYAAVRDLVIRHFGTKLKVPRRSHPKKTLKPSPNSKTQ